MDGDGHIHTSFVVARLRVAAKKLQNVPLLDLNAALTGNQLPKLVPTKLTPPIRGGSTGQTTVLQWIRLESCCYKVYMGMRVAKVQTLMEIAEQRYVDSSNNPADNIVRGHSLADLVRPHWWSQLPSTVPRVLANHSCSYGG